jgi:uncharacterized protein YcbX
MTTLEIGTVRALFRYPVKSMRAEPLETAELHWIGIHGDRQYAFCRTANTSRFPWLTGRDVPELVRYVPRYDDPDDPRRSRLRVTTPRGVELDIDDPALAAELSAAAGEEVRMQQSGRGLFDRMPVSVISSATGAALDRSCGYEIGLGRFRQNIVLDIAEGLGTGEADWLDGTLLFGTGETPPRLRINARIERCVMITIDPESAARDASIMRRVAQDHGNLVGVHCAVEAQGRIAVGDRVRLRRG